MSKAGESLSPWGLQETGVVEILPLNGAPVIATMGIPGSKSFTNRAIILAAAAKGKSILRNPLFSDDAYWCAKTVEGLGLEVESDPAGEKISIHGGKAFRQGKDKLFIGAAGTTARFLPGILAAKGQGRITLHASQQLSGRPVAELIDALRTLGAKIEFEEVGKSFPMTIEGGSLVGGSVSISGRKSSQYISGLLMAAPLAQKETIIHVPDGIVQSDYVRITLQLMKDFGVDVDVDDSFSTFTVRPQEYQGRDIALEADASTATYFMALAAGSGGKITITNLNTKTVQPDFAFAEHLKKLGCDVVYDENGVTITGPAKLKGNQYFDFNACSDSTPTLVALAPYAEGTIEVRGVEHIRHHESDRVSVMQQTLVKAGVMSEEFADGLKITPSKMPENILVDPHDDHRMAMAFAVMGALGQGIKIQDPSCVSKTCPNFFELLRAVGVRNRVV